MLYYGKQRNNRCGLPLTNRDYRFKRRGGQVVDGQATATVASYFRAWIPGLIEPKYDCHKFTLRHPISSARLKKLAQVRDFCMIRSSKFPTNDQTEARCFSEMLYTRIVC